MIKILLSCGQGFSSGFIATSMRKAAKSKLVDAEIKAVGDIEVADFIKRNNVDIILIGPHIAYKKQEFEELAAKNNCSVKIAIMKQKDYSTMNGAAILKDALELLK